MAVRRGKVAGSASAAMPDEAIEALLEAHPDLELVDRELDVGEGRMIDLACVDGSGRLWLVSWVTGADEHVIVTALDSMVWFDASHAVLAQHFECPRLRPDAGLQVALLAEGFPGRLRARLRGLNPAAVRLFELKRLSSARGARAYVVPVESGPSPTAQPEPVSVDSFLEGLDEDAREMAVRLMRRIERIDDRLHCTAAVHGMTWHLPDGPLCELSAGNGRLAARVLPSGSPRPLAGLEDLETSVDEVLGVYVDRLPKESEELASPSELANVDPAALLTPEEIEAFRQPS